MHKMDKQVILNGSNPSGPWTVGKLGQHVHMGHAKMLALLLVLCCIVYHHYLHVTLPHSQESCKEMFTNGQFDVRRNTWKPNGCNLHRYSISEAKTCLTEKPLQGPLVFMGDASVQHQYQSFLRVVTARQQNDATPQQHTDVIQQSNLSYTDGQSGLNIQFIWSPLAAKNRRRIYQNLVQSSKEARAPVMLVIGGRLGNTRGSTPLQVLKKGLTEIVPLLKQLEQTTKIVYILQEHIMGDKSRHEAKQNSQIEFNDATQRILSDTNVTIWESLQRLHNQLQDPASSDVADSIGTDMLLNMLCNDHIDDSGNLCCKDNKRKSALTPAQIIVFCLTALSIGIMVTISAVQFISRKCKSNEATVSAPNNDIIALEDGTMHDVNTHNTNQGSKEVDKSRDYLKAIHQMAACTGRLGVILVYFIVCDRQDFFMKQSKSYSHAHFTVPLLVCCVLGVVFSTKSTQTTVLHRDQTDEWKGWMQLVILIYHITGASQVLSIYMQIRVLVSSYLFMSGFGHFYFYFTKGDYSLYRFCMVMFRCNLLTVVLCLAMERPYQFYYFVPLVSFWFVVCYAVMSMWPRVTRSSTEATPRHYVYIGVKLSVLVFVIFAFYASEWLFDVVFLSPPLAPLFTFSDGSVHEWRFRWKIDRYSTLYGMLFALAMIAAKKKAIWDDTKDENLFSLQTTAVFTTLSILGLVGYLVLPQYCGYKEYCNEIHAYTSLIPILSFVILRNIFGWMRARYSYFYAWVGKISLELFISQYHIWLADDTHKVLVLIPHWPPLNVIVTSFIFVCIAHEIHSLTAYFSAYVVPKEWTHLLRNIIVFLIAFVILIFSNMRIFRY